MKKVIFTIFVVLLATASITTVIVILTPLKYQKGNLAEEIKKNNKSKKTFFWHSENQKNYLKTNIATVDGIEYTEMTHDSIPRWADARIVVAKPLKEVFIIAWN